MLRTMKMFNLLRRTKLNPSDLLTSKLFDDTTFYKAFLNDLKHCKKEVIIESPYITTARVATLVPILRKLVKKGVRVRINTRFPGHHDELLRIQAWMSTKTLKQIGVKVYFYYDYHHRKISVIDSRTLYEGSLNILSQGHSSEIMRRIESEQLTKQMIKFLRLRRWY